MVKQFIDTADTCVEQSIAGLLWQRPDLRVLPGTTSVVRRTIELDKISLVCGGGSGHEPAHAGFVTPGCLDGAVCGNVFASPSHRAVLETIRHCSTPQGVLIIIKNYQGDVINFGMAAQLAAAHHNVKVRTVVFGDDVAFGEGGSERRGIAGCVLFYKVLGHIAASRRSTMTLDGLAEIAESLSSGIRSYGAALESCTLPGNSKPNVDMTGGMEFGLGIHGESGNERVDVVPSVPDIIGKIIDRVLCSQTGAIDPGRPVVVALNNLGNVTELEMGIVVHHTMVALLARLVTIERLIVGKFMTSLDMRGVSITTFQRPGGVDEALWSEALVALDQSVPGVQYSCTSSPLGASPLGLMEMHPAGEETPVKESSAAGEQIRAVVLATCTTINEQSARFDELDAVVGDGDMGRGVARGMSAAIRHIPSLHFSTNLKSGFADLGSGIADAFGGTSGPLLGAFVAVLGSHLPEDASRATVADFCNGFIAGVSAVQAVGGARVGDRTMVDVLAPVADYLQKDSVKTLAATEGAIAVLDGMLEVASSSTVAVRQLRASKGRSRYLEDRVVGKPDPGCEFAVLALSELRRALQAC